MGGHSTPSRARMWDILDIIRLATKPVFSFEVEHLKEADIGVFWRL
jgi:hypothetical protein